MKYYSKGRLWYALFFGKPLDYTLRDYDWGEFFRVMSRIWFLGGAGVLIIWNFIPITDFFYENYGILHQSNRRPNEQGWNEMVAKGLLVLGVYGTIVQYRETRFFLKFPENLKIPHEFSRLFFLKQEEPSIKLGDNFFPVYETEFPGVRRVKGLSGIQVKDYFLELAMVDELPQPKVFRRAIYQDETVVFVEMFLYCIETRWGEIRLHGSAFDQKPDTTLSWVIEVPTKMVREHAYGKGKWELRFE